VGWIDPRLRHDLDRVATTVRAEVPAFVAFDPTDRQLARLRGLDLRVSVGSRSPLERQRATGLLARLTGASVHVVPDSHHLACVDAPEHLARAVLRRRLAEPA
jgi:pimeloyl-ACP methyl ester carboxylesterase